MRNSSTNLYCAMRLRTSATTPPPPPATVPPTPSEQRLATFKRFYETVTRCSTATSLPPTPLGHGGSERILNNELLHESPWQASCVEVRERVVAEERRVLSYDNIDFARLRRGGRLAAEGNTPRPYSNAEDVWPKRATPQGPGLDVVHYYETSSEAGLAGYQRIAMQVRKGVLPGSCTNFSAECGFAVWVVPLDRYAQAMKAVGLLPK
ncbi:hypothetical protein ABB37_07843 [Leptomonas pyrrhocoris]|uniref:Uncharacterized protein n=1 Tax=Leptomonas pyrrhocoris TaxID=157538 RepID=A0A0M9FUZ5_LEPPY|nr:hypothetical protein ABB37_07843 [Leptomonas pyrrhocoris]KPA76553.1 hypothetical protein ABB37_07843 [Leptomonas pyrrhocoris]|eukprot:XP_015654992.1 hypothetical protein ABB37_07843 [Leptomonas pyrrhocoris]